MSLPVQSMTGYAQASAGSPRGTLSLELRSVNARFVDVQFRIADELRALEPVLRELITARVARGKVDCRLSLAEGEGAPPRLNEEALRRLRAVAEAARQAFPDAAPPSLSELLRWPGVLAAEGDVESLRTAAAALCRRAIDELVAARSREGAKLAAGIVERVHAMHERVEKIGPLVPEAIAAYQAKIAERLREAIGSADDERIRTEIALFATKVDVAEELDRLGAHLGEVERVLRAGGAVGKRLDFLAQELNREANTLASKASSAAIADGALELKLLIEQIREQVQNLE
ncbi:MAG TPA: YicC/YloC family endoribonuclease [Burkholderiales bacterium]|nr:YicC/YloC family endoribonuclease [Burkholderiales bacterium]